MRLHDRARRRRGNYSLYRALADRLFVGPRFFYSGRILSMTGGHGDMRQLEDRPRHESACGCAGAVFHSVSVIVVEVPEVGTRRAAPGRALHQDHGLGGSGFAHRSDLDEPVPRRRDSRHRGRVHRAAHLRRRALPSGEPA